MIREAYRSYRAGKYADALAILENTVFAGSREPYPLLLLVLSNLQMNRFSRVDELLSRFSSVDQHYQPYHQLRAYLFLKGAPDYESALAFYVELHGKYPSDRVLSRAIKTLRGVKDFTSFQRIAKIEYFVRLPKPSGSAFSERGSAAGRSPLRSSVRRSLRLSGRVKKIITGAFLTVFVSGIAVAAIVFFGKDITGVFTYNSTSVRNGTAAIDQLTLDGSGYDLVEKISKKRRPEFYFSADELRNDFSEAKRLIRNNRLNDALMKINRILNSNANMSVKERAEFLKSFIINIDDRDWAPIPYREIANRPYLYIGVAVEWKGRVANMRRRQASMVFNLLVDYRSDDVFSGMVDVFSETAPDGLKNGDMIKLKAVYMNSIPGGNLYLTAKNIEQLVK